jgi:hypothetical protein
MQRTALSKRRDWKLLWKKERENVPRGERESTSPKGGKMKNELHA